MPSDLEAVARAQRERDVAIKWANQSVDMLKDAFFPVADALRGLEAYLRNTPHHNATEAAAARKALARFDAPDVLAVISTVTAATIDRARAEERAATIEACAKVADPPLMHRTGKVGLWRQRRAQIAADIRSLNVEALHVER